MLLFLLQCENNIGTVLQKDKTVKVPSGQVTFSMQTRHSKQLKQQSCGRESNDLSTKVSLEICDEPKRSKGRPKSGNVPPPAIDENGDKVYNCEVCNHKVQAYHSLLGK